MTEEVKTLLDEVRTEGCRLCIHMKIGRCAHIQQGKTCGNLYHKAADLIESLSAELEQVKRERDAAVDQLRDSALCLDCEHCAKKAHEEPCKTCLADPYCYKPNWKWRGVKEEDHDDR